MKTRRVFRRSIASVLLVLVGCTHAIDVLETPNQVFEPTAIAMLHPQLPLGEDCTFTPCGSDGPPADALDLFIGTGEATCSLPFLNANACGPSGRWLAYLVLSPALQKPGTVA